MFEGKKVIVEWLTKLETVRFIGFTKPNGEGMFHIADTTLGQGGSGPVGWGFYRLNPWFERFQGVVTRFIDVGLVEHWKFNSRTQLRRLLRPDERLNAPEKAFIRLGFDDTIGIFTVFVASLVVGAVCFACEYTYVKLYRKRKAQETSRH